jgi:lipid A ethanolaminephosphotransferase
MKYWHVTLIVSVFLTVFTNNTFWANVVSRLNGWPDALFLFSLFAALVFLTHTLLSLCSFRWLLKPAMIIVLITSAAAAYFMDQYTTMIDKNMILNIFESDMRESSEFLNLTFAVKLLLLGILPAWLVYRIPVIYPDSLWQGLWQRSLIVTLSAAVAVGIILSQYADFSAFGRNHRDVRHFINPENYIFSVKSALVQVLENNRVVAAPIATDAKLKHSLAERDKPNLVILVVGETVRAANLALNGYDKPTNPDLLMEDVVSFTNTYSCGTATATSLPCMFSHLSREEFSAKKARAYQRLPDVVQQAGVNVLWRENNTGCKGNCDRITTHELADEKWPGLCQKGHCFDEILLQGLDGYLVQHPGDQFIILHQKGNHGPAYYLRYPPEFEQFEPVCKTNQLADCTQQEIVNAYDNALLYTDYLLAKTINYLRRKSADYNTAMIYMSDHGESLGENNLYLHGMPYLLAPDTQKHIPLIVWLSDEYRHSYQLSQSCLAKKADDPFSHDNLFSSMLGLLAIETTAYDPGMDIFASCRAS